MKKIYPVARLANLREDRSTVIELEETEILPLRVGDEVRAIQTKLPHADAPLSERLRQPLPRAEALDIVQAN